MKVLIVDDFADYLEMLKVVIRMKGHQTVEATNGMEAIEVATREQPDLILIDLNLPVLDGREAIRQITTGQETSHIPVIAISSQCKDEWDENALAAGALKCIEKPIDFSTLNELLEQYPPTVKNGPG